MHKILHLISSNGFFGAENVLLELCRTLQENSRFVPIVGLLDHKNGGHLPLLDKCNFYNLETQLFPCRGQFDRQCIQKLKRYITENGTRFVHSHGYKSNFYALLAKKKGVGLISTCHNWIPAGYKMGLYTLLDKLLLRCFNKVVAVSEPVRSSLAGAGIKEDRIAIIHNGVDTNHFRFTSRSRQDVRRELNISDDAIVIGWTGRISPEKGLNYLMKAATSINAAFPGTYFVLIGDGALKGELEKAFGGERIRFLGIKHDTAPFYSAFDLFTLPSLTEGLPMVVLEAMASGLPVVASRVGALPHAVRENETGYLIQAGRADLLEATLRKLITDHALRKNMGVKAREHVERFFSSDIMTKEYESLYHQIMAT